MKDFAQLTRVAIVFGTVFAYLLPVIAVGRFGDSHGCPQVLLPKCSLLIL